MASTLDLSLRPRSFAELKGERALLLGELQRRDGDVRDLFAQLLVVAVSAGAEEGAVEPRVYDEDNDDGNGYDGSDEHVRQEQQQQHRHYQQKGSRKQKQQWWDQEQKFQRDLRGFLHRRIENAVDKERAILLRLGELSVEIQVS